MNTPVLVAVQCRLGSTRLPAKALYPLAGIPMISFLLRRLKCGLSGERFQVVVATTVEPQDGVIAEWAAHEEVSCVRGHPTNLVERFALCLSQFPADYVVRVTVDNPFTCPLRLNEAVESACKEGSDYVQPLSMPLGAGVDVFSAGAVTRLREAAQTEQEREHLNLHILQHKELYRTQFPQTEGIIARPDIGLTVDTIDDWRRAALLCHGEGASPWIMTLEQVIEKADRLGPSCS